MNRQELTQQNRRAWNEATLRHQAARGDALRQSFANDPDFNTFNGPVDGVILAALHKLHVEGAAVAHLPCNNGRELISLMRILRATTGVGFDLSDAAIGEAKTLAEAAGCPAQFYQTDILDISSKWNAAFDFLFVSEGSLQWFENLPAFFGVVSRLLKPGGRLLLFEIHPTALQLDLIDESTETVTLSQLLPYLQKGPWCYESGLDYIGGTTYSGAESHWFLHPLTDIYTALTQNGLRVDTWQEHPLEAAGNALSARQKNLPLSHLLTATRQH